MIRSRVYTHHARLAAHFRAGRVLLAGDAAHLMPVWQGQGYNTGLRDATNLGWKLAAVLRGMATDALLDTYEQERRPHAAAMIGLSVTAGRIFSPINRWVARLRDALTLGLNLVPAARDYVTQMRFKPMPSYTSGFVLPGPAGKPSPVGRMFPQPRVQTAAGKQVRLDEALGPWFAVLAWGGDPAAYMDAATRSLWQEAGARFVAVVPPNQVAEAVRRLPSGTHVIGDATGRLKAWFSDQPDSIAILRPDRFVAATCGPQAIGGATAALWAKLRANPVPPEEASHVRTPAMPVAQPADRRLEPTAGD